eukprot:1152674-Pelagomonas_calceolata.AAC.1
MPQVCMCIGAVPAGLCELDHRLCSARLRDGAGHRALLGWQVRRLLAYKICLAIMAWVSSFLCLQSESAWLAALSCCIHIAAKLQTGCAWHVAQAGMQGWSPTSTPFRSLVWADAKGIFECMHVLL